MTALGATLRRWAGVSFGRGTLPVVDRRPLLPDSGHAEACYCRGLRGLPIRKWLRDDRAKKQQRLLEVRVVDLNEFATGCPESRQVDGFVALLSLPTYICRDGNEHARTKSARGAGVQRVQHGRDRELAEGVGASSPRSLVTTMALRRRRSKGRSLTRRRGRESSVRWRGRATGRPAASHIAARSAPPRLSAPRRGGSRHRCRRAARHLVPRGGAAAVRSANARASASTLLTSASAAGNPQRMIDVRQTRSGSCGRYQVSAG